MKAMPALPPAVKDADLLAVAADAHAIVTLEHLRIRAAALRAAESGVVVLGFGQGQLVVRFRLRRRQARTMQVLPQ